MEVLVYIVKTMTMNCIAAKSVMICLRVVKKNRFTHDLAHDTFKLKF